MTLWTTPTGFSVAKCNYRPGRVPEGGWDRITRSGGYNDYSDLALARAASAVLWLRQEVLG